MVSKLVLVRVYNPRKFTVLQKNGTKDKNNNSNKKKSFDLYPSNKLVV